jgi:hypothetical protein
MAFLSIAATLSGPDPAQDPDRDRRQRPERSEPAHRADLISRLPTGLRRTRAEVREARPRGRGGGHATQYRIHHFQPVAELRMSKLWRRYARSAAGPSSRRSWLLADRRRTGRAVAQPRGSAAIK